LFGHQHDPGSCKGKTSKITDQNGSTAIDRPTIDQPTIDGQTIDQLFIHRPTID
jgi:hypothetical protein